MRSSVSVSGRTLCVIADTTVARDRRRHRVLRTGARVRPDGVVRADSGRRVVDSRNGIGGPRQPLAAGEVRSFDPVAGHRGRRRRVGGDAELRVDRCGWPPASSPPTPAAVGAGRVVAELRRPARRQRTWRRSSSASDRQGVRRVVGADERHRRRVRRDDRTAGLAGRATVVRQADVADRSILPRPTTSSSAVPGTRGDGERRHERRTAAVHDGARCRSPVDRRRRSAPVR